MVPTLLYALLMVYTGKDLLKDHSSNGDNFEGHFLLSVLKTLHIWHTSNFYASTINNIGQLII